MSASAAAVSLQHLLAAHAPLLLLDAATTRVQVGLLRAGAAPVWWSAEEEAGTGLFRGVEAVLAETGLAVSALGGVAFCEGPGSILGVRTSAAAIRAWQAINEAGAPPAWSWRSLTAVAHAEVRRGGREFAVIADARRASWHAVVVDASGAIGPLRRVAAEEVPALAPRVLHPAGFRTWAAFPVAVEETGYDLAQVFPPVEDVPLFTSAPEPDAFLHEEPSYQLWTPAIHQKPVR